MNHYLGLIILSLGVGAIFVAISKEAEADPVRYLLKMFGYMIVGSLVVAWVMSWIPW